MKKVAAPSRKTAARVTTPAAARKTAGSSKAGSTKAGSTRGVAATRSSRKIASAKDASRKNPSRKDASLKGASLKGAAASAAGGESVARKRAAAKGAAEKGAVGKSAAGKSAAGKAASRKAASGKAASAEAVRKTAVVATRTKKTNAVAMNADKSQASGESASAEGWHGWDDYAAFYDWENARTVGRRDITFWRDIALRTRGRTLELGCGTGRILAPLARQGVDIVGIDRSVPMLARAQARVRRLRRMAAASGSPGSSGPLASTGVKRSRAGSRSAGAPMDVSAALLRGDIRQLPFEPGTFDLVMAPYGILQSLVRERDLTDTLRAVFAALAPGGRFGLDLVPDVPRWKEYTRRISMRGRRGPRGVPVSLVESVRQDRAKGLTIFDQEFIEGKGKQRQIHRFSLTFRTVSIQSLRHRLERAGFLVDAVLGGYDGRPWDPRADTWVLMASKPAASRPA